jgi:RNA polymerase sigma-70 factor (ECF subfamily)
VTVPAAIVERLYDAGDGARWPASTEAFAAALTASAEKAFGQQTPDVSELERFLRGLHLRDLALACACMEGVETAWDHLMREHRPALYRAADAIDPTGRAREIADALWADLFRNLFRYFHGRSSLATWLRAVLAQRHIDAIRAGKRLEPLPDDDARTRAAPAPPDPADRRCRELLGRALDAALAHLDARDRLRLACYHAQELTLAETGRMLREHEATVSRRLAQTRRTLRSLIEQWLRENARLPPEEVARCIQAAVDDPGQLDLSAMLDEHDRKIPGVDRSKRGLV